MRITDTYVYPAEGAERLIDLAIDQLTLYLLDPTATSLQTPLSNSQRPAANVFAQAANLVGLATSPQFITREGRGTVGDESVVEPAEIIFGNMDKPGVPYARILFDGMGDMETFGNKTMQPIQFVIDAYADEWQGLLNNGLQTDNAGNVLSSALFALLSPTEKVYPLLKTWGFNNPRVRPGAGIFDAIELIRPLTFSYDLHYLTP